MLDVDVIIWCLCTFICASEVCFSFSLSYSISEDITKCTSPKNCKTLNKIHYFHLVFTRSLSSLLMYGFSLRTSRKENRTSAVATRKTCSAKGQGIGVADMASWRVRAPFGNDRWWNVYFGRWDETYLRIVYLDWSNIGETFDHQWLQAWWSFVCFAYLFTFASTAWFHLAVVF